MKKLLFLFILIIPFAFHLSAQVGDSLRIYGHRDDNNAAQKGFSWYNAFAGGSGGLTFGSLTDIELDPEIGYRFGQNLYLGVGIDYEYYNYTDSYLNYSTQSTLWGGNIFARYLVYKSIFAEAQLRATNWDAPQPDFLTGSYNLTNVTVPAFNLGVGYMGQIGERSAWYIVAMYDLLYGNNSPSDSPLSIQVGFDFGL